MNKLINIHACKNPVYNRVSRVTNVMCIEKVKAKMMERVNDHRIFFESVDIKHQPSRLIKATLKSLQH